MSRPLTDSDAPALQRYYRWHAPLYDLTRWSFLFGRKQLLQSLPGLPPAPRILEIGCGTGHNIARLESIVPDAHVTGVDLSAPMLRRAARKLDSRDHVDLVHGAYGGGGLSFAPFDLVLCSYALSMTGDHYGEILQQVRRDLVPGGYVGVVDFRHTSAGWFRRWMGRNHVRMDASLHGLLEKYFTPLRSTIHPAYLGLWHYFVFVGRAD